MRVDAAGGRERRRGAELLRRYECPWREAADAVGHRRERRRHRRHARAGAKAVAARHEVNLTAAASQFGFAHPAITCIIPGTRQPDRVSENFDLLTEEIPADFWTELKGEGLVRTDAPLPS